MTQEPIVFPSRFTEALRSAADLHVTQVRKGTHIPYIAHLLGVASIALHHGADEDEAIAALLHDAIEDVPEALDADWVRDWLRFRFGERVLDIVEGCTDADVHPKPEWRVRKEAYVEHVRKATKSVVLVSASDKLHNASAILADYREVEEKLWERFNPDAGKAGVIGYYRGLVRAYRSTRHHPRLVCELDRVVTQIEAESGHLGAWPLPRLRKPLSTAKRRRPGVRSRRRRPGV